MRKKRNQAHRLMWYVSQTLVLSRRMDKLDNNLCSTLISMVFFFFLINAKYFFWAFWILRISNLWFGGNLAHCPYWQVNGYKKNKNLKPIKVHPAIHQALFKLLVLSIKFMVFQDCNLKVLKRKLWNIRKQNRLKWFSN